MRTPLFLPAGAAVELPAHVLLINSKRGRRDEIQASWFWPTDYRQGELLWYSNADRLELVSFLERQEESFQKGKSPVI